MPNQIRILIADDHAFVHEGLHSLLATQPDFELVGNAYDGSEALALAGELHPDVILMDLVMPRMDGLEAIRQIRQADPQSHILLLTSFADDQRVFPAIKSGALGYLLKDTPRDQIYLAIRNAARGRAMLNPMIAFGILQEVRSPPERPLTDDPLTPQEVEILHIVTQGLSEEEIASRLGLEVTTVALCSSKLLQKLHRADHSGSALYVRQE